MAFRSWMMTQSWWGLVLDKDKLGFGMKLYSPSTCCFITNAENNSPGLRRPPKAAAVSQASVKQIDSIVKQMGI